LITEIEASRQQESALMAHRLAAIAALLWQRILEAEEADPDPGHAMITRFAPTTAEVSAATNLSPMGANNLVPRASPAQRLSPNPVHHVSPLSLQATVSSLRSQSRIANGVEEIVGPLPCS
jgi:hypothetical protein